MQSSVQHCSIAIFWWVCCCHQLLVGGLGRHSCSIGRCTIIGRLNQLLVDTLESFHYLIGHVIIQHSRLHFDNPQVLTWAPHHLHLMFSPTTGQPTCDSTCHRIQVTSYKTKSLCSWLYSVKMAYESEKTLCLSLKLQAKYGNFCSWMKAGTESSDSSLQSEPVVAMYREVRGSISSCLQLLKQMLSNYWNIIKYVC